MPPIHTQEAKLTMACVVRVTVLMEHGPVLVVSLAVGGTTHSKSRRHPVQVQLLEQQLLIEEVMASMSCSRPACRIPARRSVRAPRGATDPQLRHLVTAVDMTSTVPFRSPAQWPDFLNLVATFPQVGGRHDLHS